MLQERVAGAIFVKVGKRQNRKVLLWAEADRLRN